MVNVAKNIAREGSFANPFSVLATGPTAHVAPLYPLFMAAVYKVTGGTPGFEWITDHLVLCLHGIAAALLVNVSRVFWSTETPGLYGALASILLPVFLVLSGWEAMACAVGLMLFCLYSYRVLCSPRRETSKAVALGVFAGAMLLLNPMCSIPIAVWVAFQSNWANRRSTLRFVAVAALTSALVCAPWIIRCYSRLGGFIPIRDDLGAAIYASNNDCAEFSLTRNMISGCDRLTLPNVSITEAQLVRSTGELNYNWNRLSAAKVWIEGHRGRFIALTAERILHFWYPDSSPNGERLPTYAIWLVTSLSFAGLALAGVRRLPMFKFVGWVFVLYPLPYYVVQSSARFLYPIFWLNLLCAGYFLHTAFTRFRPPAKQCENDGAPDLPVIAIGR
jgi:hypothetical protein